MRLSIAAITLAVSFTGIADAVKHENFKTCEQSGFCKRNRAYADHAASASGPWIPPYTVDSASVRLVKGKLTASVLKQLKGPQSSVELPLTIEFQESGVARVSLDEKRRQTGDVVMRHGSPIRKQRYNEAEDWVILNKPVLYRDAQIDTNEEFTLVSYGPDGTYRAMIRHKPFTIDFLRDNNVQVRFNAHGLLNMEHWRAHGDNEAAAGDVQADDGTWWEESFGGNTDTKPRGPESVGVDISFPGYEHVYGIPGHAGPLALKETRGQIGGYTEPYRLYNSDVFEYEMDSPMTLYGAIPFMYAHRQGSTVGVFWLNAAETWIDIEKQKSAVNSMSLGTAGKVNTRTHWFSETGLLDVFVFLGPEPKDVLQQYSSLTGYTQLPQEFAIGYHQCRWNYVTDDDVRDVDNKMSRYHVPYDVIWLDIEYTDGKKYFTWDKDTFADPLGMQKQLDETQRKLVAIIDPHIKNEANYPISEALRAKDLAVKNNQNNIYEGWCWPGSSHWIDCFNPLARKWWNTLYKYKSFVGSAQNLFIWNDMNEPSVFNGPETTMPKDNIHHGGWEHRDIHNVNGMTFHNATYEAMKERDTPAKRPFVLTRSYYAGSQRLGPMWTGDNQAEWSHLAASLPMVLSMNIAGYPFAGADVGGFFGNPSKELLTRWYQAGAFYPFFRGHAHIDTRRREPYLVGDPYRAIITQALRLRYSLLPAWYTAFHEASVTGAPIVRPEYYVNPTVEAGFDIEDQFYLGSTGLLVKPVVTEGAESVDIRILPDVKYYDYFTYKLHTAPSSSLVSSSSTTRVAAPLDTIPLLMQEGHIFPRKDRPRKSSGLMRYDPYTLMVVLDTAGRATGELYIDDGESFAYQSGAFIHLDFSVNVSTTSASSTGALELTASHRAHADSSSKQARAFLQSMKAVRIEKIIIINAPESMRQVSDSGSGLSVSIIAGSSPGSTSTASMTYFQAKEVEGLPAWAIIKNPGVTVADAKWSIALA